MGPGLRRDDARRYLARTRGKPLSFTLSRLRGRAGVGALRHRECIIVIPSPSLPRGDDLDLVAVFERGLRPLGSRQHVKIRRDRKVRPLISNLAQQRIAAAWGVS